MPLLIKLKKIELIEIKLEDGREIKIHLTVINNGRAKAFVDAPKTISIKHSPLIKDDDDRIRNPS